mgnify:CR=1 FL=1
MKKVVIDINVIVDLAFQRDGFKAAEKVIDICLGEGIKGYACSHEITTLAYLLQKKFKMKKVKYFLDEILDMFDVISSNNKILRLALDSEIDDYEDAVIEVSAKQEEIDYIITRNLKDFAAGEIEALSPEEFILLIEEN